MGSNDFPERHIGPTEEDSQAMAKEIGYDCLDDLINHSVPESIRLKEPLNLPMPLTEQEALAELKQLASQNKVFRSYIGLGYYNTYTPSVILRSILENPAWYTAYTPYQPEIAQGRLEALLNFQTMIADLCAMDIANASLLDEATAAAEAVTMAYAATKNKRNRLLVASNCHPQTIAVIQTRALPLGIRVEVTDLLTFKLDETVFAALVQYPDTHGEVYDFHSLSRELHENGSLLLVASDLMALTLLRPPGEFDADIVIGNSQRFGVPLGFGGPHAAFMATKDKYKRLMPGRLIGVTKDADDQSAYRLSLQTREQHIRRDKATSNICTAQVLLAVIASMYAVYHGPDRIVSIARRITQFTHSLAKLLEQSGFKLLNKTFFDTLTIELTDKDKEAVVRLANEQSINFRTDQPKKIGISLDETTQACDVLQIYHILLEATGNPSDTVKLPLIDQTTIESNGISRTSDILVHPIFNTYHTETEFLRYLRSLELKDISLATSMIPLGSCTMKLNAASEMLPVTWPEFGQLHPFVPSSQSQGYKRLFDQLEAWLTEITGFAAISLQPNAGSQGEYAGLLAIRAYHESRGDKHRTVCLIPESAHGTNPASAIMVGYEVIAVACSEGGIDLDDLGKKVEQYAERLAAIMVTYPSTYGVFEPTIKDICQTVHQAGGQVYMDGANLNAQVGLCKPGDIGADVCHLNLHKTFCIPHGGGGPGMGPIGVADHLAPFLSGHPLIQSGGKDAIGPVSAAPWGSPSILPISWMYIRMTGATGLTHASKIAILNANYVAEKLKHCFPVLFKGENHLVAHECIIDCRAWRDSCQINVEDIAKRLMDFGFHAPTMSWPVPGTMMIEPTESESRQELDRFCEAMISIYEEIKAIREGKLDTQDNPLKNAPHTASSVVSDNWSHPYPREQAAFPQEWVRANKFWPPVGRVDNVYGDRNLVCSCPPMESAS
ncbi:MAG: aminomethyl-transferring glycine dehydrogenase [Verrucomicrobiota bacterium]